MTLPKLIRVNGTMPERRTGSQFHNTLAMSVVIIFAGICFMTYAIVTGKSQMESWAAGIVGAILGYWANNLTQIISYYYGSSSPAQAMANQPGQSLPGRLIRGQGPPPSGVGADGDFYEDELTKDIYGPKEHGAWGPPQDHEALP